MASVYISYGIPVLENMYRIATYSLFLCKWQQEDNYEESDDENA